eukprot:363651-Chlamydomonas_euryale.AAC.4
MADGGGGAGGGREASGAAAGLVREPRWGRSEGKRASADCGARLRLLRLRDWVRAGREVVHAGLSGERIGRGRTRDAQPGSSWTLVGAGVICCQAEEGGRSTQAEFQPKQKPPPKLQSLLWPSLLPSASPSGMRRPAHDAHQRCLTMLQCFNLWSKSVRSKSVRVGHRLRSRRTRVVRDAFKRWSCGSGTCRRPDHVTRRRARGTRRPAECLDPHSARATRRGRALP